MAIPRGETTDFLALGVKFEVIEGPNLQHTPDDLTQINRADGTFLQENASRRKVSGTLKVYEIDDTAVLPRAGANWTIAGAAAVPYRVRIDEVNREGQTEDGYLVFSISFHYFVAIAAKVLEAADITTAPTP